MCGCGGVPRPPPPLSPSLVSIRTVNEVRLCEVRRLWLCWCIALVLHRCRACTLPNTSLSDPCPYFALSPQAVVIAAALSMSSSAFVLQLLAERGEAPTRVGSATLGILLFQDIAVVPFLVLLPLIESNGGMEGTTPQTLLSVRAGLELLCSLLSDSLMGLKFRL